MKMNEVSNIKISNQTYKDLATIFSMMPPNMIR